MVRGREEDMVRVGTGVPDVGERKEEVRREKGWAGGW